MKIDDRKALDTELLGKGIDIAVARQELRLLADIFRALRNNWKDLALAAVIGLALGWVGSFLKSTRFLSTVQVMINTQVSVETNFTPVESGQPISTTALESEIEVLRSLDLVETIVDRFDLVNDPEFSPEVIPADERVQAPASESAALEENAPAAEDGAPGLEDGGTDAGALQAPGQAAEFSALREKIIANVADRREVAQAGNISAVYAITFLSEDPVKAARLANALAEEYIAASRTARLKSLELSQGWLASRTESLKIRLSDLSVQREEFLLTAPYAPEEVETIKARNVAAGRRVGAAGQELEAAQNQNRRVSAVLAQPDVVAAAVSLQASMPELAPFITAAQSGAAGGGEALKAALISRQQQTEAVVSALTQEVATLEHEIATSREVLIAQAARDAELSRIENDLTVAQAIYQDFVSQLSRRTQQDRYLDDDARIISAARPALDPAQPQRRLFGIVGLVLALLAATAKIVVDEIRQPRMRNRMEYEAATSLPMIGVMPECAGQPSLLETFEINPALADPKYLRFARKLRISLLSEAGKYRREKATFTSEGESRTAWPKFISGASSAEDEGQSSTLLALAIAFAEAGERVLLVDMSSNENVTYTRLLTMAKSRDKKTGPTDPKDLPPILATSVPSLSLLKVDVFGVERNEIKRMAGVMQSLNNLAGNYDRLLLDTPPLLAKIDSAQIHQAADEVIFFSRWNHTTKGEARGALQILENAGVLPLAVVATRFDLNMAKRFGEDTVFYYNAIPTR